VDPERELTELESDLKATSEDIAADAARVKAIEEEKARLSLGDPRLAPLAAESEALTERMNRKAKVESALVEESEA
jgi:uncharacterized protein YhaN